MCSYIDPISGQCKRENIHQQNYCIMHFGWDTDATEPLPPNSSFRAAFEKIVQNADGNWRGFVFPADVPFPKQIDFPVDARACQFSNFDLEQTIFTKTADFSGSIFRRSAALRGVRFSDSVNFERCRFMGTTDFLNVLCTGAASFCRSEFSGRTVLRINFSGSANLNETLFRDAVTVSGWRNVNVTVSGQTVALGLGAIGTAIGGGPPTILRRAQALYATAKHLLRREYQRLRSLLGRLISQVAARLREVRRRYARTDPNTQIFRVFEVDAQFQEVVFSKPDLTVFSHVDMSRVFVRGTNFRGVRFLAVNWYQPHLGRSGIQDEVFFQTVDGPLRRRELPAIEETYRNIRVALEEGKSFNTAADFYIGEMEAARAQLPLLERCLLSVPAVYSMISRYGTSVARAVGTLVALFALYMIVTLTLQWHVPTNQPLERMLATTSLKAFRLVLFQDTRTADGASSLSIQWIDTLFRLLALIQTAIVAFALRARIKRH
jgi:uncharacterized protein YjbI with pentapeptide repeats